MEKCTSGEEIIVLASTLALTLSQCMDNEEICVFNELIGLLKHDLELIKIRRILCDKDRK